MRFDRISALKKKKGVSYTYLCAQVGRGSNYIADCKNKGVAIPDDVIAVWADILDTSPEYLKGETDVNGRLDKWMQDLLAATKDAAIESSKNMHRIIETDDMHRIIEAKDLLQMFSSMSNDRRKQLLEYAEFLTEKENKSGDNHKQ